MIGVIELLHPVTIGVAVACVPVATVAVSGAIDLLSHRHAPVARAGAQAPTAPARAGSPLERESQPAATSGPGH